MGRRVQGLRADQVLQGSRVDLLNPGCRVGLVLGHREVLVVLGVPERRLLQSPSHPSLLVDLFLPVVRSVHSVLGSRVVRRVPVLPEVLGFPVGRALRVDREPCGWTLADWVLGSGWNCSVPCGFGSAAHRPAWRWPELTLLTGGHPFHLSLPWLQEDPVVPALPASLKDLLFQGIPGLLESQ